MQDSREERVRACLGKVPSEKRCLYVARGGGVMIFAFKREDVADRSDSGKGRALGFVSQMYRGENAWISSINVEICSRQVLRPAALSIRAIFISAVRESPRVDNCWS